MHQSALPSGHDSELDPARQRYVLERMVGDGLVSQADADAGLGSGPGSWAREERGVRQIAADGEPLDETATSWHLRPAFLIGAWKQLAHTHKCLGTRGRRPCRPGAGL